MKYVLDTSAVIAYLGGEEGANDVARILEEARHDRATVFVSFISLMEIEYQAIRSSGEQLAQEVLLKVTALPIEVSYANDRLVIHQAARIKAASSLSVSDAWIAALADTVGGTLVHKDPDFAALSKMLSLHALPYKTPHKKRVP